MQKKTRRNRLAIAGKSVLGIDPGKSVHCGVVLDPTGLPLGGAFRFGVNWQGFFRDLPAQLGKRLGDYGPENLVVAVESACNLWLTIAHHFHVQGYDVVLVSPLTTKHSRAVVEHDFSKSDPKDAFLVTDNAQKGHYDAFVVVRPELEAAHRLSITYHKLLNDRNRIVNRLTSFVQMAFPEYLSIVGIDTKTSLYLLERCFLPEHFENLDIESEARALRRVSGGHHGEATLKRLREAAQRSVGVPLGDQEQAYRLTLDAWIAELPVVDQQLAKIEEALIEHTRNDPAFPILVSVPRVSEGAAARLIAETRGPGRFEHFKQIEKLAGLNIRMRDSVTPRGARRISRIGNPRLRRIIYLMLQQTVQVIPLVRRRFLRREIKASCYRKNLLAATSQMLSVLMALIKQNRFYEDRPEERAALQPLEETYQLKRKRRKRRSNPRPKAAA